MTRHAAQTSSENLAAWTSTADAHADGTRACTPTDARE